MELITKAKEILIMVWQDSDPEPFQYLDTDFDKSSRGINLLDATPSLPTLHTYRGEGLDYVIADTLSVTQDDPDEQTFEFETTDTPEVFYTAGAYKVDLNNAELSEHFIKEVMGWVKTDDGKGYVAPETYKPRYVALQIKFSDTCYFLIPKISIAPKLVLESVKTSLVYGTLSGTAANAMVGKIKTSIAKFNSRVMWRTPH